MFLLRNFRVAQRLRPIYTSNASNLRWFSTPPTKKQNEPEFELTDAVLDAELATNQKLSKFEKSFITAAHVTFMRAGFTSENAFKVIKKYPKIVRQQPKKLENALECWRVCQFTQTQYIQLFIQCPELLEFDNETELRSRLADIKMFATKPKNIWRLLMASPDILIDNQKVFDAKVNYLLNEMKVDESDAVKSGVFSHSLVKLKCRHMLLVRLGIYKEKSKNATPLDSNKNPRIARIVDTSDSEFVRKICGISLAEFNAFNALYRRELEEAREEDEEIADEQSESEDENGDESDDEFNPNEKHEYDARDRNQYYAKGRKPKVKK